MSNFIYLLFINHPVTMVVALLGLIGTILPFIAPELCAYDLSFDGVSFNFGIVTAFFIHTGWIHYIPNMLIWIPCGFLFEIDSSRSIIMIIGFVVADIFTYLITRVTRTNGCGSSVIACMVFTLACFVYPDIHNIFSRVIGYSIFGVFLFANFLDSKNKDNGTIYHFEGFIIGLIITFFMGRLI